MNNETDIIELIAKDFPFAAAFWRRLQHTIDTATANPQVQDFAKTVLGSFRNHAYQDRKHALILPIAARYFGLAWYASWQTNRGFTELMRQTDYKLDVNHWALIGQAYPEYSLSMEAANAMDELCRLRTKTQMYYFGKYDGAVYAPLADEVFQCRIHVDVIVRLVRTHGEMTAIALEAIEETLAKSYMWKVMQPQLVMIYKEREGSVAQFLALAETLLG